MSDISDFTGKIHRGDALSVMTDIPTESIHLVATSPPYWDIKNYQDRDQIGYNEPFHKYIERLGRVWKQCERVLNPGCRMCINIGDEYKKSNGEVPYHIKPINAKLISNITENTDFYFLGSIIWRKISNTETSGGAPVMGSYGRPRNGYVSYSHEYINIFKKPGEEPDFTEEEKKKSEIEYEEWMEWFDGHWNIPGKRQTNHPAPFPEEIPRRLIRMFTFIDDIVLDPFIGSGTTAIAAQKNQRQWIGIDLNQKYVETAKDRIMEETDFYTHEISQW